MTARNNEGREQSRPFLLPGAGPPVGCAAIGRAKPQEVLAHLKISDCGNQGLFVQNRLSLIA
jgi:hypothetical protein